jgi:hypothetical protein
MTSALVDHLRPQTKLKIKHVYHCDLIHLLIFFIHLTTSDGCRPAPARFGAGRAAIEPRQFTFNATIVRRGRTPPEIVFNRTAPHL